MKDYYEVLGVGRDASALQIKRAFRQLAIRFHPDRNREANAAEIFKEINEAYEVLGEPEKKISYDNRLRNGLEELFGQEPAVRHRDPAYRPKNYSGSRPVPASASIYDLMRRYLIFASIFNGMGFIIASIFFIDYMLPYQSHVEKVTDVYRVSARRNSTAYFIVKTASGKEVKLYAEDVGVASGAEKVIIETTPVFSTPMSVSTEDRSASARLAYLYRYLVFFPFGLWISSFVGLIMRNKTEVCFNTGVTSFLLLLITLTLLL